MEMTQSRVVLAVRDLEASTAFYRDVLGCHDCGWERSTGWSLLSRDGFAVMLGECADATPASQIGDHSYVAYVVVDDVDTLRSQIADRLTRAGSVSEPRSESWGMRECCLTTPDGHRIMFGQEMH
jgi:catechol 2,3-dioxygenase-like lactoylglutathione lyase family enzyme